MKCRTGWREGLGKEMTKGQIPHVYTDHNVASLLKVTLTMVAMLMHTIRVFLAENLIVSVLALKSE